MNYRQSLASSVCIHLTEEDDEPPPNFRRNSDTTTTSPLIGDPFPEKNNTGCPYFRRAFIFEAGSTKSPFTAAQAVKRFSFISKLKLKHQSLRAAGYYSIFGCMNKSISTPESGPKRICLKSGLLEALS